VNLYRLVLADDYTPFRQVVKMVLSEKPGIEIIGEAGDGFELLGLLDRLSPNMVILDISMPKLNGIEATRWIRKTHPDVKILVLTLHSELTFLSDALDAGAEGYLLKEDDIMKELFSAIEVIRKGGVYVSPLLGEWPSKVSQG
jgi:DNA-binding NarL/FixJ family response regulator